MTFSTFVDLLGQHWVLILLVLCPIAVVTMALAALSCEACGAPFGIFRRRQKTIDLCLRCAVLHDIRRASDKRKEDAGPAAGTPPSAADAAEPGSRQEDHRAERRFTTQSPVELGMTAHPR
ncbi:MAG TPA: hypothetical protein VIG47_06675 [Gemmatimonadaceae bacterium]